MNKATLVFLLISLFTGISVFSQEPCGTIDPLTPEARMKSNEKLLQQLQQGSSFQRTTNDVIIIPVVVHVVYNTEAQNISVAQIQSQIDVLNEDFRRLNSNADDTWPQAASPEIEFRLAKFDPDGLPTNGITRTYTYWPAFDLTDPDNPNNPKQTTIKYTAEGGKDNWDAQSYLNMYVCDIIGLRGYATFPDALDEVDGIVVDYEAFGRGDEFSLMPRFELGSTATHEVGHWLRLSHMWGDGGCDIDDGIEDTPVANSPNYGCGESDDIICYYNVYGKEMYQNYMDYTDDSCTSLFTAGQVALMRAAFSPRGSRVGILSSLALTEPCPGESTLVSLTINFDDHPEDISWDLKNGSGDIIQSGGPYTGGLDEANNIPSEYANLEYKVTFCLPDDCYDFTIYDAFGDGLLTGSYTITDEFDNILVPSSGGEFTSETKSFCTDCITSTPLTTITTSINPLCSEVSSTTLTASGGEDGYRAVVFWYEGPNGTGNSLDIGSTLTVSPSTTTTYYARREGACNVTTDTSITIEVLPATEPCIIDCVVSEWSPWSDCDAECGTGMQTRTRTVITPAQNGGADCPTLTETRSCESTPCPVNCVLSEWSEWSTCTEECGSGTQTRTRTVLVEPKNGGDACGPLIETRACNTQPCPIDCVVSEWSTWSDCDAECGTGIQTRTRTVITPAQNGGADCPPLIETRVCESTPCPVNCVLSEWSEWSACTEECGSGTQTRTRTVLVEPKYGGDACGPLIETRACNTQPCPIDCVVSEWSPWSDCDAECGTGMQTRTRTVITPAQYGGAECPELVETRACNTQPCPIDCVVSEWSPWSDCDAECGTGMQTRTRTVITPAQYGGAECPELVETRACNTQPCPIDCVVSEWSAWSDCDTECGTGMQTRTRTVITPAQYGGTECPELVETRACNEQLCPIDCEGYWTEWSECTNSCGEGEQSRTFIYTVYPENGGKLCVARENAVETRPCNVDPCPIDCVGSWSEWSECEGTFRERTFNISQPAQYGGIACEFTDGEVQFEYDTAPPNITCPDAIETSGTPGECKTIVDLGSATVIDNCTGVTVDNDAPEDGFPFGETIVTWTATDASGTTAQCTQLVTIKEISTTTTVSVAPTAQQYSDLVTFVATVSPYNCADGGDIGGAVTFKVGSQTMGTANIVNGTATLTDIALIEPTPFGASPTAQMAPGNHVVSAEFNGTNTNYIVKNPDDTSIEITKEDAIAEYTGLMVQATAGKDNEAEVVLTFNIQDITCSDPDPNAGDIRNATAQIVLLDGGIVTPIGPLFTNKDGNVETDIVLTNPDEPKTGSISWPYKFALSGQDTSESFTVGILINGYYIGSTQTVINVYKPTGDFITGGGYIMPNNSAGAYASNDGLKTNFGFNVKYNKNGNKVKGHMNIIFRRLESDGVHVYQIKGNAMESLGIDLSDNGDPQADFAQFITKANLKDVTDPLNPVSLGGNLTLKVDMTDRGEPGDEDSIAINLTDGGLLLYSSNWTGISTEEMTLTKGNLVVHSGSKKGKRETSFFIESNFKFKILNDGNPFDNKATLSVDTNDLQETVVFSVYDISGKLIFNKSQNPKQNFVFGEGIKSGIYLITVQQGTKTDQIRLIKK